MRRLRRSLLLTVVAAACTESGDAPAKDPAADRWTAARERMVEQIAARGLKDPRVLAAMRSVPRHEFVPTESRALAYEDRAPGIGHKQTMSRPYMVAVLTELAQVQPTGRVLEIGTGSGYGAAVLAELAAEVYTIEIVEPLARRARETIERLGYENVHVLHGDGYAGWPEAAPFDAIVVTAAPPSVPEPLKRQLRVGGRLVIPVGKYAQSLRVLTRTKTGFEDRRVVGVSFGPMAGEARRDDG